MTAFLGSEAEKPRLLLMPSILDIVEVWIGDL